MNKVLSDKIEELKQLCILYNVSTMHAFGSVCTDKFNDKSDIDLLISFNNLSIEQYTDNYFDLHYKLQDLFKREIDLLTENSLSNPYFIKGVERTKQLIYAAWDSNIPIDHARKIVDLRNWVIHGYDKIDEVIIWGIVSKQLPILKDQAEILLKEH